MGYQLSNIIIRLNKINQVLWIKYIISSYNNNWVEIH